MWLYVIFNNVSSVHAKYRKYTDSNRVLYRKAYREWRETPGICRDSRRYDRPILPGTPR